MHCSVKLQPSGKTLQTEAFIKPLNICTEATITWAPKSAALCLSFPSLGVPAISSAQPGARAMAGVQKRLLNESVETKINGTCLSI